MSNGAYKVWTELPPWAKGVTAIVAVGSAFLIGKQIYKTVKGKLDKAKYEKEGREASDVVRSLSKKGEGPTLNDAQLESMANSLVTAFDGCGTDHHAVYNVFNQVQNDADVYALIQTYGTRKYDGCNWLLDFGDTELSLSAAMSSEMAQWEKRSVNEILAGKNIKFRFT